MKKLILILSTTALLFACSSPLDQKVKIADYKEQMAEIKANNTEYSEDDFDKAGDYVGKKLFASAMGGESADFNKTYREILDEAKAENEEITKKREAKEARLEELRKEFDIVVTNGEYFHDSGKYAVFPNQYKYDIKVSNHSNKTVTAFKGRIIFSNEKGEELLSTYIDEAFKFPSGESAEATESTSISSRDDLTELKALPFDKITAKWEPSLLIFEDGSRMESLD